MERDPRKDPGRGDLSCVADGSGTTYWLVLARTAHTVTFVETQDTENFSVVTLSLEAWAARSASDEVLHVAEA